MNYQDMIIFVMEMIGTVAFAASGAMMGVEKKMDVFGVCVLGVITAAGGGMIRDIILGITPPNVFRDPTYALVAIMTSCLVFLVLYIKRHLMEGRFREQYERVLLIMDTIGLGIFTVVGVHTGIEQGYVEKLFLLVFLGTITGIGGGILRDMMAGVPPYVFVRHVYASASIVGAIVCVKTYRSFGAVASMIVSFLVVVLIRFFAARYHWNLPKVE